MTTEASQLQSERASNGSVAHFSRQSTLLQLQSMQGLLDLGEQGTNVYDADNESWMWYFLGIAPCKDGLWHLLIFSLGSLTTRKGRLTRRR